MQKSKEQLRLLCSVIVKLYDILDSLLNVMQIIDEGLSIVGTSQQYCPVGVVALFLLCSLTTMFLLSL